MPFSVPRDYIIVIFSSETLTLLSHCREKWSKHPSIMLAEYPTPERSPSGWTDSDAESNMNVVKTLIHDAW